MTIKNDAELKMSAENDSNTEVEDEFEYDEEGNIVIPDIEDDEADGSSYDKADFDDSDEDGADSDDASEHDSELVENEVHDAETEEEDGDITTSDEKDAMIESLKNELATLRAQSAETLEKLGVKTENVLEGLEKVAAESDDVSLDEYRKRKTENQRDEAARKLLQQMEFEKKMRSDFTEIQREFPETRNLKSLREIENLAKFGRFRDLGLSPKEAYAAANPDSVRKSVAVATKQQSLNDTRAHLKSAVPTTSKDDGITISKKELKEWRELFPNLTDKEISKLYRESAKK